MSDNCELGVTVLSIGAHRRRPRPRRRAAVATVAELVTVVGTGQVDDNVGTG